MSSYQALITQNSLPRPQLLPSRHYPNYFQPPNLRTPLPERRHYQHPDEYTELLRQILTVPYFSEHHEKSACETETDEADDNFKNSQEDDYVLVKKTDNMVQLTEVPDEHFETQQPGPVEDDGDYTDTDSEISTDSEYDPSEETLAERLAALKDIVPPTTRGWISNKISSVVGMGSSSLWFAGKTLWVVSSTALLLGVPFAICVTEEQQVMAMEQEYKMREVGNEMLGEEPPTADKVGAALGTGEKSAL